MILLKATPILVEGSPNEQTHKQANKPKVEQPWYLVILLYFKYVHVGWNLVEKRKFVRALFLRICISVHPAWAWVLLAASWMDGSIVKDD